MPETTRTFLIQFKSCPWNVWSLVLLGAQMIQTTVRLMYRSYNYFPKLHMMSSYLLEDHKVRSTLPWIDRIVSGHSRKSTIELFLMNSDVRMISKHLPRNKPPMAPWNFSCPVLYIDDKNNSNFKLSRFTLATPYSLLHLPPMFELDWVEFYT